MSEVPLYWIRALNVRASAAVHGGDRRGLSLSLPPPPSLSLCLSVALSLSQHTHTHSLTVTLRQLCIVCWEKERDTVLSAQSKFD